MREILEARPRTKIEFWTDAKYYKNVTKLTTELGVHWVEGRETSRSSALRVRRIPAGKLRRYSGWTIMDCFRRFDVTIRDLIIGNIIGLFKFLAGIIVCFFRLLRPKNRPDAIFLKGGYVGLPVGIVARLFRIPYVIHESDAAAGLSNRILMGGAAKVAFGIAPPESVMAAHPNFVYTGTPVGPEFRPTSPYKIASLKKAFSFRPDCPLVVVTGGSQGSVNLNCAVREILPELLKFTSVALVAGRKHYEEMIDLKRYENWENASLESNFRIFEFSSSMDELMGAADIVVSRAGATTIAELAALRKAVILVPFERLPGSHQVRNAERLGTAGAAKVLLDSEMSENPKKLLEAIRHLVKSPELRGIMANRLGHEAKTDAARQLAELVIGATNR